MKTVLKSKPRKFNSTLEDVGPGEVFYYPEEPERLLILLVPGRFLEMQNVFITAMRDGPQFHCVYLSDGTIVSGGAEDEVVTVGAKLVAK